MYQNSIIHSAQTGSWASECAAFTHSDNSNVPETVDSFGIVECFFTEGHIQAAYFGAIDL